MKVLIELEVDVKRAANENHWANSSMVWDDDEVNVDGLVDALAEALGEWLDHSGDVLAVSLNDWYVRDGFKLYMLRRGSVNELNELRTSSA